MLRLFVPIFHTDFVSFNYHLPRKHIDVICHTVVYFMIDNDSYSIF